MNRDFEVIVVKPSENKAIIKGRGKKAQPQTAKKAYPVLSLIHGAYCNSRSWLEIKPNLPDIADDYGMIFVTPSVLNSWYFDSPKLKDFQYETFKTKDLINYIDSNYNSIPTRAGPAITGLSMGGYGALFLSIRHKDLYGVCASMSGGV